MVFVFGVCELDVARRELRRAGVVQPLEPRAFTVLVHLLTQRHRAVSKDELLATCWPGEHVTEAALTRCLKVIRRAVADDGVRQCVIKTLRGHGYRFVAAVATPAASPGLLPPHHHVTTRERMSLAVAADAAPEHAVAPPSGLSPDLACGQCQTRNRATRQFCAACGQVLWWSCRHCGFRNHPDEQFCGGCGSAVATAVPIPTSARTGPPRASPPVHLATRILTRQQEVAGERKVATVLVIGFEGVQALCQGGAFEEVDDLLHQGFALVMAAVHQVEGVLMQIAPYDSLALFGVPLACEDHVLRALHAALEIQRGFTTFAAAVSRTHGVELTLRLGVHTGSVMVNAISPDGQRAYTAPGATLACATGLQHLSRAGAIVVSAAVRHQAAGFFQFTALGTHTLPGVADPVEVYVCDAPSPVASRLAGALARQHTVFQGRQQELALLQACWSRVCRGQGQVVCLVGEAGIGKSRLAYECQQALGPVRWHTAQALAYGQAMPYHAVLPLLRTLLGVADTATPARQRQAIQAHLTAIDGSLAGDTPLLAQLLGVPVPAEELPAQPPEVQRRRIQHVCAQVLLQQAADAPLCFLVEDGHWLDPSSQELLDLLVTTLARRPILLLCTARPGFRPAWTDATYFHQVAIEPLDAAETRALLRTLLQPYDASPELHAWLHARTGGNPLFIEELVRTLRTRGFLTVQGAVYGITPAAGRLVPETLQSLLQARLDRLPAADKDLLQVSAVVGPEVAWPVLASVMAWTEDRLHRGLQALQATEFLYAGPAGSVPTYTFTHALVHEAAYASLLPTRRRALHARIVEAMEALTEEWEAPGPWPASRQEAPAGREAPARVDLLAHHALQGAVWDKAVTYCQQAGALAFDRAAFREAVGYCEQALQALTHLPEDRSTRVLALDLRLAMVPSLNALGEYGRSLTQLEEAEALARALDDRSRLGWVLTASVRTLRRTGDYDGAVTAGERALAVATALGDHAVQVSAALYLGQVYYAMGDYHRAAALLRQTIAVLETGVPDPHRMYGITARGYLAMTLRLLGAFAEGRRHGEEALRLAALEGHGLPLIIAHGCLGYVYLQQGDLEHTTEIFAQGLALCRASGNLDWGESIGASLGYAYALQGRVAEGRALMEEAISESTRIGMLRGWHVAWLSEVCLLAGCTEEALRHARQALDLSRQKQERGDEARALHQLGAAHACVIPPDIAQAEAHYQQALALAEQLGMRPLMAHCQHGLGTLYASTGQVEQARAALRAAVALYRAMHMTLWLPQTEAALAWVEAR